MGFFCIGITELESTAPAWQAWSALSSSPVVDSLLLCRFNQVDVIPVVAQVYLSPHVRCHTEIQCWHSNSSTMCAATHRGPVAKKWLRHKELDNSAVVPGLGDLRRQKGRVENSSLGLTTLPLPPVWPFSWSKSCFFHQFLLSCLFPFCCVLKQSVCPFYL